MWQRKLFTVLLTIIICNVQYSLTKIDKNGYTIPSNDINLEYGKDIINITCYITNETMIQQRINDPSPSDFIFRIPKEVAPKDQIIRLNATAIRYLNMNPGIMEYFISCMYKNDGIGMNSVIVGTKPNNVTDFDCIGYNLENLTCSWTRDRASKYLVTYELTYHFGNRELQNNCGVEEETNNKISCFWNNSKQPYYRPSHDKIYFNLVGRNHLGISNQSFEIDHYRRVKISAPHNLKMINATVSTFRLSWQIPDPMVASNVYLKHRIMYTYENSGFHDFKVAATLITSCKSEVIYFNLTDLPYAYTLYDIRVGMRMNVSDSEDMWSTNATLTHYSNSTLPGTPIANINSFYSSDGSTVTIYWKQLERFYQNGPDFTYLVKNKRLNNTIKTTNGYMQFSKLDQNLSYTFEIWSKNSVGISLKYSTIVVPALNKPKMVMDIPILKEYTSTKYQLSWSPPLKGAEHLVNYTVYWCESLKVSSSHLCSNINWITLPKNITSYNITISENNNVGMAISANGLDESTSMIWPECTVRHNKQLRKITDLVDTASSTNITITWTVKCTDKTSNVENYFIEYCSMNHTESFCQDEKMNKTIRIDDGGYVKKATIEDLDPYTTYRIQLFMQDFEGTFIPSTPIRVTTLEGTPAPPINLKIVDRSNTSISLEWSTPQRGNGKVIRHFEIKYNNMTTIVNRTITIHTTEKQNYTLNGLNSYEKYNISIRACINECSAYTSMVYGTTKIGVPKKIGKTHFNSLNNSVSWERPLIPGGRIDYYEIEVMYARNDAPIHQKLNTTVYALERCGENSPHSTVSYKVRAVNLGEENQIYYGVWSDSDEQTCQKARDYKIAIFISMSVFLFGMMLLIIVVFGKRCYIYFRTMKDVQFQLPEGLYDNKDRFPRGNEEDYIKEQPGDDQFLLYDKDGIKRSGDSSGCSSGQDSAESDSGTSLSSSTDSGTEQPKAKDDDLVGAIALDHFNSSNPASVGPYCQLGYTTSHPEPKEIAAPFHFPKDIVYIRSNESTSSSDISPYIRCDQMPSPVEDESRPVNSGYVANPILDQMPSSNN